MSAQDFMMEHIPEMIFAIIGLALMVILLLSGVGPSATVTQSMPTIIGNPVTIVYENIPCMINCYTSLQGDEVTMLSKSAFLDIDDSSVLVNWFPCNKDLMIVAMLVNEITKWDYNETYVGNDISEKFYRRLIPSGSNFLNEVKKTLFNCLSNPYINQDCNHPEMSFRSFCRIDDYLSSYNIIPCSSPNTFIKFLDYKYLSYASRRGKDIDNNFVCDSSIGEAYNPGYSLCASDPAQKYDDNDCLPSWLVLTRQQQTDLGREASYGRCEDFALLYYSLFRSVNTMASDMEITAGVCEMPCACRILLQNYLPDTALGSYSQEYCYSPANLSVKNIGVLSGCDNLINKPLDSYHGEYYIHVSNDTKDYYWSVYQDFNVFKYYRKISLDGDFTNDGFTRDGITYSSINFLTDSSRGFYDMLFNKSRIISSISFFYFDAKDINVRLGMRVKLTDTNDECNESVVLGIGSNDSKSYYTIVLGEVRDIVHNYFFEGEKAPEIIMLNNNPLCVASIEANKIILTPQDVCYGYTDTRENLIQECANYVTSAYSYIKGDQATKELALLQDFPWKSCSEKCDELKILALESSADCPTFRMTLAKYYLTQCSTQSCTVILNNANCAIIS